MSIDRRSFLKQAAISALLIAVPGVKESVEKMLPSDVGDQAFEAGENIAESFVDGFMPLPDFMISRVVVSGIGEEEIIRPAKDAIFFVDGEPVGQWNGSDWDLLSG